jgi:hypothetical protein
METVGVIAGGIAEELCCPNGIRKIGRAKKIPPGGGTLFYFT